MSGGYPDAFWIGHDEPYESDNYRFSYSRRSTQIGTDFGLREPDEDQPTPDYPFLTCEMGPGMQVAYHRRPYIRPDDVCAILVGKLAGGANLPGYYVFHGGTNPEGKRTRLNESHDCNYPNDVPVFSYDFQAPIGEFGQVRESFFTYKPFHLFLHEYGEPLAPMLPAIPEVLLNQGKDREQLQYACRSYGNQGFLFVNNHVRNRAMPDVPDVRFRVELADGSILLPSGPVRVPGGAYFIWPLNLPLGNAVLKWATVQPLCRLDDGTTFVFVETPGIDVEYAFEAGSVTDCSAPAAAEGAAVVVRPGAPGRDCRFTVRDSAGETFRVITLTRAEAERSYKFADRLYIAENDAVLLDGPPPRVQHRRPTCRIHEYRGEGAFATHTLQVPEKKIDLRIVVEKEAGDLTFPLEFNRQGRLVMPSDEAWYQGMRIRVDLPEDALDGCRDVLLPIDYMGDSGRLFIGDHFVHDHFYNGRPWEISLRRFAPEAFRRGLTIKLLPMRADAPVYLDDEFKIDFTGREQVLEFGGVTAIPVYESVLGR